MPSLPADLEHSRWAADGWAGWRFRAGSAEARLLRSNRGKSILESSGDGGLTLMNSIGTPAAKRRDEGTRMAVG